jgi:hypothetical protein
MNEELCILVLSTGKVMYKIEIEYLFASSYQKTQHNMKPKTCVLARYVVKPIIHLLKLFKFKTKYFQIL